MKANDRSEIFLLHYCGRLSVHCFLELEFRRASLCCPTSNKLSRSESHPPQHQSPEIQHTIKIVLTIVPCLSI